jgi:hypothetical protein
VAGDERIFGRPPAYPDYLAGIDQGKGASLPPAHRYEKPFIRRKWPDGNGIVAVSARKYILGRGFRYLTAAEDCEKAQEIPLKVPAHGDGKALPEKNLPAGVYAAHPVNIDYVGTVYLFETGE